jgi:selenide,water dikinase
MNTNQPAACDASAVREVLATFARHGFDAAAEIGEVVMHDSGARLQVV